jgi:diacylglycerol kinase
MQRHYQRDASWRARYRAFIYAGRGIVLLVLSQWNARIHAVAAACAIGAGWWLGLTQIEWCIIVLAILLVWVTEALNTAIEFLVDLASPHIHPLAGKAKDVAAGAVLAASIGAVLLGLMIFGPKVAALLRAGGY